MKPFQKSHNTAFRLLAVLLYGLETNLPYLSRRGQDGRLLHLELRSGACAYTMRMTIPRLREHILWLESIGLVSNPDFSVRGIVTLTLKLPETYQ